jgi:hypothetical protein
MQQVSGSQAEVSVVLRLTVCMLAAVNHQTAGNKMEAVTYW